jgi:hypothetical protein
MTIRAGVDRPLPAVRGMELPAMLADLLACGRWRHPGDDTLRRVLPWFEVPLDFLPTTELMERESASLDMYADDEQGSRTFHVYRGSVTGHVWGPWLDAELAFYIAINRELGDDVAIALDYRKKHWTHTAPGSPAVVASDPWTYPGGGYLWRPVAPSFEDFAAMLGIPPASSGQGTGVPAGLASLPLSAKPASR